MTDPDQKAEVLRAGWTLAREEGSRDSSSATSHVSM